MCQLQSLVMAFLSSLWEFFNTQFFTSVTGAFAGAYGGQFIVEKIKNREILLKEIRNTNTAIIVTFDICNVFLGLKKQYVKPMWDKYDSSKNAYSVAAASHSLGRINNEAPLRFVADFQTIAPFIVPVDTLQKLAFEGISLNGRLLNLTSTLSRAIYSLLASIVKRNQLIEEYKANGRIQDNDLVNLYFGLQDKNGDINNDYPSTLEAIFRQTDDCIYFSSLLCKDLGEHGEKLKKEYGEKSPKINKVDFSIEANIGLMPDSKEYSDWDTMFVKSE